MTTPYAPCLTQALTLSKSVASRQSYSTVGPAQLLLGLLNVHDGSARRMLAQVGITPALLQLDLERLPAPPSAVSPSDSRPLTDEAENMLYIAQREANFWESEKVETMHLLLALLRDENTPISQLFNRHGVQYQFLFDMAAYDRVGLPGMGIR